MVSSGHARVQFHVTNRQSAPLFSVRNGEVVAAIVNAAAQWFGATA